jgi:hypothetical protein
MNAPAQVTATFAPLFVTLAVTIRGDSPAAPAAPTSKTTSASRSRSGNADRV